MTSDTVKTIIAQELVNRKDLTDVYGIDLTQCLVEPRKELYQSSVDEIISFELWTVMEEVPGGSGYKITFDEEDHTFGLGISTKEGKLVDIGTHGTFLETVKGM